VGYGIGIFLLLVVGVPVIIIALCTTGICFYTKSFCFRHRSTSDLTYNEPMNVSYAAAIPRGYLEKREVFKQQQMVRQASSQVTIPPPLPIPSTTELKITPSPTSPEELVVLSPTVHSPHDSPRRF